jgi:sporulation protein YlmC with PRC-barrel domain
MSLALALPLVLGSVAFGDHGAEPKDKSVRLSQVLGMAVHSKDHHQIGTIREVVIDKDDHEIAYVAMSRGGFLGFGDKLFALDWTALSMKMSENGSLYVETALPAEAYEKLEGFDQNHWPTEADASLTEAGAERPEADAEDRGTTDAEKPNDQKQRADRDVPLGFVKASRILGLTVRNTEGQTLGSVADMVLMAGDATGKYVAVSYDTTLGLGGKRAAIACDSFEMKHDDGGSFLLVDMTLEDFKKRKSFESGAYPKDDQIDSYLE